MSRDYIGIVVHIDVYSSKRTVIAVINPDEDDELDNPIYLRIADGVLAMAKIPRGVYEGLLLPDDVSTIVKNFKFK